MMEKLGLVDFQKTEWMDWLAVREGWNEEKNAKQIGEFWKNTKYTLGQKLKQVVGRDFAWCGATASTALVETGYYSICSARAADYMKYGIELGTDIENLVRGALVVIQHQDGSHHVTFFDSWKDKPEKLAIFFGGNQSNAIRKSIYDLNVDKIAAIRWPVKINNQKTEATA